MNGNQESKPEVKLDHVTSPESYEVPKFEIDVRGYWDSVFRNDMFIAKLRQLPFYTPELLYSGFTGSRARNSGELYAGEEASLLGRETENPLDYAMKSLVDFKVPKIAVYEASKMKPTGMTFQYKIDDPTALLAVLQIKD